jgi:hypothetical protein
MGRDPRTVGLLAASAVLLAALAKDRRPAS